MKRTAFLSVFALCAVTANAATIHVPADQPTIQAGIDLVVTSDTVSVACSTYSETAQTDCVTIDADTPIGRILLESQDSITSTDGFLVTDGIVAAFYNDILGGWMYRSGFCSPNNNYVIFANSSHHDKELIFTSIITLDTVFTAGTSVVSDSARNGSSSFNESTRNTPLTNDPQLSL